MRQEDRPEDRNLGLLRIEGNFRRISVTVRKAFEDAFTGQRSAMCCVFYIALPTPFIPCSVSHRARFERETSLKGVA